MIFFTVGYQMSFDRMTKTVDEWAGRNPCEDIFAQIGPTSYLPRHVNYTTFMRPNDFVKQVQGASVVVAHAGMGSILTALRYGKPILVMPRRGDLRETRNDHQIATSRKMLGRPGIEVAMDEESLVQGLDRLQEMTSGPTLSADASPELIADLKRFISGS
jgi:UDP-N-acetylglucosamine transferase subunit ALG13